MLSVGIGVVECLEFGVRLDRACQLPQSSPTVTAYRPACPKIDPRFWGATKHCADGPRAPKNLGTEPLSFQLRRKRSPYRISPTKFATPRKNITEPFKALCGTQAGRGRKQHEEGKTNRATTRHQRHGSSRADPRGPFALGHECSVLARRQQGGVRIRRPHGEGMEYRHGTSRADARGTGSD
jgi:hypothetical protein